MEGKGERAQAWESDHLGLSPDSSVGFCEGCLLTSQDLGFLICEMERLATNLGFVVRVIEGNRGKARGRGAWHISLVNISSLVGFFLFFSQNLCF